LGFGGDTALFLPQPDDIAPQMPLAVDLDEIWGRS